MSYHDSAFRKSENRSLTLTFWTRSDVKPQPQAVYLFIWVFAGVVLVLIVRVELKVFSHREEAAPVECRRTPLPVPAVVVKFSVEIRDEMVSVDCQRPFERRHVAIAPGEMPATPVEICTVSVG